LGDRGVGRRDPRGSPSAAGRRRTRLTGAVAALQRAALPAHVGIAVARDLLLSARKFDAAEAQRIGLLSPVVLHERLREEAVTAARQVLQTPPVIAGILRVIHAGQVYTSLTAAGPSSAERTGRRIVAAHGAFLAAARQRDADAASTAWSDYLLSTSRLVVARGRGRAGIEVVPLWRMSASVPAAGGAFAGAAPPRRMATVVANEIRARIADGGPTRRRRPAAAAGRPRRRVRRVPAELREALRILEMESLLTLRSGDRSGAQIRHPSTRAAAQLAGTVLAAARSRSPAVVAEILQWVRLGTRPAVNVPR
jgi:DNA-binding FadR family transcriptional regulator